MDQSPNLSEFQVPGLYVIPRPDRFTRLLRGSKKGLCVQGLCKLNSTDADRGRHPHTCAAALDRWALPPQTQD